MENVRYLNDSVKLMGKKRKVVLMMDSILGMSTGRVGYG